MLKLTVVQSGGCGTDWAWWDPAWCHAGEYRWEGASHLGPPLSSKATGRREKRFCPCLPKPAFALKDAVKTSETSEGKGMCFAVVLFFFQLKHEQCPGATGKMCKGFFEACRGDKLENLCQLALFDGMCALTSNEGAYKECQQLAPETCILDNQWAIEADIRWENPGEVTWRNMKILKIRTPFCYGIRYSQRRGSKWRDFETFVANVGRQCEIGLGW